MTKINDLLDKAKAAINGGDARYRQAAELIVQAQGEGATQQQIAKRIGKSRTWLTYLLQWRKDDYRGAPFGSVNKPDARRRKPLSTGRGQPAAPPRVQRRKPAPVRPDDDPSVTAREFSVEDADEPEEFDTAAAKTSPQNWMTGILLRADQALQMCRDLEFLIAGAVKVSKNKTATRSEIVVACRAVATAWEKQAQKVEDQNGEVYQESQKTSVL